MPLPKSLSSHCVSHLLHRVLIFNRDFARCPMPIHCDVFRILSLLLPASLTGLTKYWTRICRCVLRLEWKKEKLFAIIPTDFVRCAMTQNRMISSVEFVAKNYLFLPRTRTRCTRTRRHRHYSMLDVCFSFLFSFRLASFSILLMVVCAERAQAYNQHENMNEHRRVWVSVCVTCWTTFLSFTHYSEIKGIDNEGRV